MIKLVDYFRRTALASPRKNLFKTASLARSAFQPFFGQLIEVIERHFWLQHLNL
jgi:hypothetical protein